MTLRAGKRRRGGDNGSHEVRLIGGSWKRSRLPVLDRPGLRPTPDRVRETLFNWLGQDLTGWHCLDAFAGSGALGFEAASRGASSVLLIERDPALAAMLREAKARLDAQGVTVSCGDALQALARAPDRAFDLVFLDPPYASGLLDEALSNVGRVLKPGGFVYAEAAQTIREAPGCVEHRRGRAGAVFHHLFVREDDGPGDRLAPRA